MAAVTFPLGLTAPGQAQNLTLAMLGDADCTAASKLDQVAIVVTRAK